MKVQKSPLVILFLTISLILVGVAVGLMPQVPLQIKIVVGILCGSLAARILFSIIPPVSSNRGDDER